MTKNSKYNGIRIEYHILQTFPVTCLNRDDVGSPKSALIGGVNRQRISSQCWKRQVRLALREEGVNLGIRTKNVSGKILSFIDNPTEAMKKKATEIAQGLVKKKKSNDKDEENDKEDTLIFLSPIEYEKLATIVKENSEKGTIETKKIINSLKNISSESMKNLEALDVALFGRMLANASDLNVAAATSFAHAITTHKAVSEADYFTAIDDEKNDQGAGHIDVNEFSSGTFYRYICLDLGVLASSIGDNNVENAIIIFTKALFKAVPTGRQTTMTGFVPWDYAEILIRKGQPVQCSFDKPVKACGEGYLIPSILALQSDISLKKQLLGSLYGEIGSIIYGSSEKGITGIDDVLEYLSSKVKDI